MNKEFLSVVDYRSEHAAQQFVQSLRETGFGVLKNHPIPQALVESIYQHWQAFFASEDKYDYRYNLGSQDGFFPSEISEKAKGSKVKDIKEYFHFYPWGQCPEDLRPELLSYYEKAQALASELLGWIEAFGPKVRATEQPETYMSMIEGSEQTLLRVLHYPPMTGNEDPGAIRAAAHEDINLLTILPAANEPGLQVLAKEGTWQEVPCEFGYLIINVGDMLQEASAGYFPSTTHRVVNPIGLDQNRSRISLPLFLHPRPEVLLSHRHTAGSYLQERLTELGVI